MTFIKLINTQITMSCLHIFPPLENTGLVQVNHPLKIISLATFVPYLDVNWILGDAPIGPTTQTNLSGAQATPPPLAYFAVPLPQTKSPLVRDTPSPRLEGLPGKLRIPFPDLPSPILAPLSRRSRSGG